MEGAASSEIFSQSPQESSDQQELKEGNILGKVIDVAFKLVKHPKFQSLAVSAAIVATSTLLNAPAEVAFVAGVGAAGSGFGEGKDRIRNAAVGLAAGVAGFHGGPELPQVGHVVEHFAESKASGVISMGDDIALPIVGVGVETGKRMAGAFIRSAVKGRMGVRS